MFRINSIMNDSRDKVRVHDFSEDSHNNYYTILTGDNASGKSSLLSKAINFFLFSNVNNNDRNPAVELECLSERNPSKIIAICNSKFDRFTSNKILNDKLNNKEATQITMSYIHPEVNDNTRRGISGIVDQCIKNSLRHKNIRGLQDANRVKEAFMMFGLQSDLHLKCTLNTQNIKYVLSILSSLVNGGVILSDEGITHTKKIDYSKNEELKNKNFKLDKSIEIILRESECKNHLDGLYDTLLMLDAGKFTQGNFSSIYFSVAEGTISTESKYLFDDLNEAEIINILFILDVIDVSDIQVMHLNSKKEVNIVSLSSGQRTLFGNAIVLSGYVEKNCMICIDEPENSLHPEWQLNFMRFISLLCPDTLEAHILIATHSPQIISGMQFDNGCVLSLENRDNFDSIIRKENKYEEDGFYELQPLKAYREQSAGKQLTGVFKSPGYKNDFIIKKLLLILSKISKKIALTKDDNEFMDEISILIDKKRIPEGDPVQLIFKQILSFEYARNSDD